jgi:hypothetical protein
MSEQKEHNSNDDECLDRSVAVSTPWFKMKLEDMDWKAVIVVGMILSTIIAIVYILHG